MPADHTRISLQIKKDLEILPTKGLRICLLGGFRIHRGEKSLSAEHIHLHKARDLLKLLSLATDHRMHREQLLEILWPECTPEAGAHNLSQTLYTLRPKLAELDPSARLQFEDERLVLHADGGISTDVEEFVQIARSALSRSNPSDCQAAIVAYTGDLLPEDGPSELFYPRRDELRQYYLLLLLQLAGYHLEQHEYPLAIDLFRKAISTDSANEEAHRGLMRTFTLSGQRQAALRQYQVLEEVLHRELDVEPAPESQQLREQILNGSFATRMPRFEWLFLPRHNLPVLVSSFIGREREVVELMGCVQAERLVTLTGSGGVGKTRLAIKVAEGLLEVFSHGIFWVDLTSISDPDLLAKAVIEVFRLPAKIGRTDTDLLLDFLKDRSLLLLLDNCEQVLAGCVALIVTLLEACPNLHILATSRVRLNVPGEISYRVPSLPIPGSQSILSPAELAQFDSVRLFSERSRSHCQEFSLTPANVSTVTQICQRLDGIPLALELAAARTRMMTPEQIAVRLKDAFSVLTGGSQAVPLRHKTLRASIDWSFNLLLPKERRFLQRLSVFAGGWTLEAAEAVCADHVGSEWDESENIAASEVLDLLAGLVDHSLVLVEPGTVEARYRLLETIRQYGHEKLIEAGGVEPVRQRHLAYYLRLAEQADREIRGPQQLVWLKRLETEDSNFTNALDKAFRSPSTFEIGVRLVCALNWFVGIVGDFIHGNPLLKRALSVSADFGRTRTRAKILFHAGSSSVWGGNLLVPQEAQVLIEESLEIWRELGPDFTLEKAQCLLTLGYIRKYFFNDDRGFEAVQESIEIFQQTGHTWWHAWALNLFVMMKWDSNDSQIFHQKILLEETALWERTGDHWGQAIPLADYGALAMKHGEFNEAKGYFQRSLEIFQEFGSKGMGYQVLRDLGYVARGLREYDQAELYYKNCENLAQEIGWRGVLADIHCGLGFVALHKRNDLLAVKYFCQTLRISKELDQKNRTLHGIAGLASILAMRGKLVTAIHLFSAISALSETFQLKWDPVDQLEINQYLELCRGQVNATTFDQEWNLGRNMTLEQATACAQEAVG